MNRKIVYGAVVVKNLQYLRAEKGLTLKQVRIATKLEHLAQYESGEMHPRLGALRKLEQFYGVELGSLYTDLTVPPKEKVYTTDDPEVIHLAKHFIGLNIRSRVKEQKIVRGKISEFVGVKPGTFHQLECGHGVTVERLCKTAEYMGIQAEELIGAPSMEELLEIIVKDYQGFKQQYRDKLFDFHEKYARKK